MLYGDPHGKEIQHRGICIHITDSLCCTAEMNTTKLTNSLKKLFWEEVFFIYEALAYKDQNFLKVHLTAPLHIFISYIIYVKSSDYHFTLKDILTVSKVKFSSYGENYRN